MYRWSYENNISDNRKDLTPKPEMSDVDLEKLVSLKADENIFKTDQKKSTWRSYFFSRIGIVVTKTIDSSSLSSKVPT